MMMGKKISLSPKKSETSTLNTTLATKSSIIVFHIHYNHTKHQSLFRLFIVIYEVPLEFKIFQVLDGSLLLLMITLDNVTCTFLRTNPMLSKLLKTSCQWSKLNSTFKFKYSKLTMENSTSRYS